MRRINPAQHYAVYYASTSIQLPYVERVPHMRPVFMRDKHQFAIVSLHCISNLSLLSLVLFALSLCLEQVSLKRLPRQPKVGYFLSRDTEPETIQPTPYVDLV